MIFGNWKSEQHKIAAASEEGCSKVVVTDGLIHRNSGALHPLPSPLPSQTVAPLEASLPFAPLCQ